MKKTLLLLSLNVMIAAALCAQTNTFPATGAAGIGTTTPNVSSLLEIKSTTKGLLIPRMTGKQKNLIASPAIGLLVYQTDSTKGFYYYSGSAWLPVAGSFSETDPQVGANTTNKIPRWDGSALTTGAISDNGDYVGVGVSFNSKYRINGRTSTYNELEVQGKSAVRGESNVYSGVTNIVRATGFLGVKNPSGIYSILGDGFSNSELDHFGVLGVKEYDTTSGAGVYGWTRGGASANYGTMGISTSNNGTNYGTYGKATGSAPANFGVLGKAEDANVNYGVYGQVSTDPGQYGYAVYGQALGSGTNHAGYFAGHVQISSDGEALTLNGTDPFVQINNDGNQIGYLKNTGSDFILATSSSNNGNLILRTKGFDRMSIDNGGKISVNSSASTGQFNIKGSGELLNVNGTDPLIQFTNGAKNIGYARSLGNNMVFAVNSGNSVGKIQFMTRNKTRMWIDSGGAVSISDNGKIATGYLLSVKGKVAAEEVLVELNGSWPDYVFGKDYELMSLPELKQYISDNNHLPQLPSAEQMKDGIALGNMNKLLTEKVEQLTLYILQLQEQVDELKKKFE